MKANRKPPRHILRRHRDPLDGASGLALFDRLEGGSTLLIAPRVGQVRRLPPGYELNTCSECSSPVWCNARFIEHHRQRKLKLRIECSACAMGCDFDGNA